MELVKGPTYSHEEMLAHMVAEYEVIFATRLLELGIDIKTVSVLLGHSSVKVTLDFYVHSRTDVQRKAISALAEC